MRRHKVHIKKLNFTWIIQLDTNTKTDIFERKAKYIFYRKLTGKIIMNGTTMRQSSIVIKEEESARRGLGPFPLSTPSLGLGLHLFNVCLWYTKNCLVFYIIYGITIIASWKEHYHTPSLLGNYILNMIITTTTDTKILPKFTSQKALKLK